MKRLLFIFGLGILGGCDPPPKANSPGPVVSPKSTHTSSADEQSTFASRDEAIKNLHERHADKKFEANIESAPLRVRVSGNGESCERQVPPGTVLGEWMTNLDHSLERCVNDLFEKEK